MAVRPRMIVAGASSPKPTLVRTPWLASFCPGISIRLTAEKATPIAIWVKAFTAKLEKAAPVSAVEIEAPIAEAAAPMA